MIFRGLRTKFIAAGVMVIFVGLAYSGIKLYQMGKTQAELECAQEKLNAAARAISQTNIINEQNALISEEYWRAKLDTKPKIQTVEKRIIQYVEATRPGDCNLDDDELRILNDLVDIVNGNTNAKAKH